MATGIKTVGVAGSGTMGAGIAIVAARAGFKTIVYDTREEALSRARKQTEGFFAKSVERKKLTQEQVDGILASLAGTTDIGALAACDIVIEAVFEDLKVKQESVVAAEPGVPAAHPLRLQHLHPLDHRDRRRLRARRPLSSACTSACRRS